MKKITSFSLCSLAFVLGAFAPGARGQQRPPLTVLHNFDADGFYPTAALIQASDGNFYGTTSDDAKYIDCGTVFRLTPAGVFTTLHTFTGPDGEDIFPALIQASDGNFYGTTYGGGTNGIGTVYRITPAGKFTTFYNFVDDGGTKGFDPDAALIQASDGNFYGTTSGGGSNDTGTVFKLTPAGVFTNLHSFAADGSNGNPDNVGGDTPVAPLVQGRDGNFYGLTVRAGSGGAGTVFKITPAGVLTTLYNFAGGTEGGYPTAGLIQGRDGNFYGTTSGYTGYSGYGTVYKMTPAGAFTTLHRFTPGGVDGIDPEAGLVEGSDGNFYGTTHGDRGGVGYGTVFEITPAGVLTTLHQFSTPSGDYHNADGAFPEAGLVLGRDGNFYGTTEIGGVNGDGVIFRLDVHPVITSATGATATVNHAFSYQIAATNNPTNYGATGLPAGLSVNAQTGLISGTPQKAGTFGIAFSAANAFGKDTATLNLTVAAAGTPYITSARTLEVPEDTAFSYQITATGSPTSFGVQNLPSGLTVDRNTGLITGQHHGVGTLTMTLNAYNAEGKGSAYLTLKVYGAPIITSASTATGNVRSSFSYQIVATANPTSYGFQGTPNGLSIDAATGVISGTPVAAGTYTYTLNAYNGAGKGSATLTLTIYN